jgi:hypothetical protein
MDGKQLLEGQRKSVKRNETTNFHKLSNFPLRYVTSVRCFSSVNIFLFCNINASTAVCYLRITQKYLPPSRTWPVAFLGSSVMGC